MKKRLLGLAVVICMCFSTISVAEASTKDVDIVVDYSEKEINPDGSITYGIVNENEVAAFFGIEDAKAVKYTTFVNETSNMIQERNLTRAIGYYTYEKTGGPWQGYGPYPFAQAGASNTSNKTVTKTLEITGTVGNEYNTSMNVGFSIDPVELSGGVGFDVTSSWSISDTTNVELAPGESVIVYAYETFTTYNYDIYFTNAITGSNSIAGKAGVAQCTGFVTIIK